jgi:hypothetical protein
MLVTGPRTAMMPPSETDTYAGISDTVSEGPDDASASEERYTAPASDETDYAADSEEADGASTNEESTDEVQLGKRDANAAKLIKRTLKYLAICESPEAFRDVVRAASDRVIKAICTAAYNVEQGPVHLSPEQKTLFRAHRESIATLTSPRVGIESKRKLIASQKGGFAFIPILIGSALAALGSRLFGGTSGSNQQ